MKTKHFSVLIFIICLLLAVTQVSSGADFCASNATELQNHLDTAASNSESDVIKVMQGMYSGSFEFTSSNGYNITLQGGYTTGCLSRTVDPTNTILDAAGTGSRVLRISDINSSGGDITVDGFTIQNGTAGETTDYEGRGAGMYLLSYATDITGSGNITVTNNIIKDNNAVYTGGGVYAQTQSLWQGTTAGEITVADNIVQDNNASGESYASGGGIYAVSYSNPGSSSHVTVSRNLVTDNNSEIGGGIYANSYAGETSGNVTIAENEVYTNTATGGNGGGIYAVTHAAGETENSGTVEIQGNFIVGNTTSGGNNFGKGGGAFVQSTCNGKGTGGDIEFYENIIKGNKGKDGGGIYAETHSDAGIGGNLTFLSNTINGNTSDDGAGLFIFTSTNTNTAGDMIFINNIVAGNIADDTNFGRGGGIWARSYAFISGSAGDLNFTNNTIANNRSIYSGGIQILGGNNTANFYNNIIYGNSISNIDYYLDPITFVGYNNDTSFSSWSEGSGNINLTPEFKDPGSWDENSTPADPYDDIWLGGDFHLKNGSPCIDTGTNSAPDLPGTDFEGDARQIDGDRDGAPTADMGADEFLRKAITAVLYLLLK